MGLLYQPHLYAPSWKWKWKLLSCLTLCDPMDCKVHGILQARMLEWVAVPFSGRFSQPRDQTQISCIEGDSLPAEPQGKPKSPGVGSLFLLQRIFLTQESNRGLLHCRWSLYQLSYCWGQNLTGILESPFLLHGAAKPSLDLTSIISKIDTNFAALISLNFQHTCHLEYPVGLVSGALNSTSTIQYSVLHSAAGTIQN